jgi:hypothetical protein
MEGRKEEKNPGLVAHTYNPTTIQEAEAGRLQVPGQAGLLNKTLSQKTNKKRTFEFYDIDVI